MANSARQIGGQNAKSGFRYEDSFAVFCCIKMSSDVIVENKSISFSDQMDCPVDDLVIQEDKGNHFYFHQLKDDKSITWGNKNGKLKREFLDQKRQCQSRNEKYSLILVVSHSLRKKFLKRRMPKSLKNSVAVEHFAPINRPTELARRIELREVLTKLSASRMPGEELLEGLVKAFYLAWIERSIGTDGYSELSKMIDWVKKEPGLRIIRPLPKYIHPNWPEFEVILNGISDLVWYVDRGYLEWVWRSTSGLVQHPCDSDKFRKLVDRILEENPNTFEELEVFL